MDLKTHDPESPDAGSRAVSEGASAERAAREARWHRCSCSKRLGLLVIALAVIAAVVWTAMAAGRAPELACIACSSKATNSFRTARSWSSSSFSATAQHPDARSRGGAREAPSLGVGARRRDRASVAGDAEASTSKGAQAGRDRRARRAVPAWLPTGRCSISCHRATTSKSSCSRAGFKRRTVCTRLVRRSPGGCRPRSRRLPASRSSFPSSTSSRGRRARAAAASALSRPITILATAERMIDRLEEVVPLLDGIRERYAELDVVDLAVRRSSIAAERTGSKVGRDVTQAASSGGASF